MQRQRFARDAKASPRLANSDGLLDILPRYLQWHRAEGHTDDTIRAASEKVRSFAAFLKEREHSLALSDISPFQVMDWMDEQRERKLKQVTIRTRFVALHGLFAWAVDWELCAVNPCERVRPPKVPREGKRALPDGALDAVLDLCPLNTFLGARRASMVLLFATTGMRRAELASLELDDLDLDHQRVRVMGKGQKERYVHLHRIALKPLLRYLHHRREGSLACLWLSEERRSLTKDAIGHDMLELAKRAGIWTEGMRDACHIYRRTWAGLSIKQGIPKQYIMAQAGWTTPAMPDRYGAWLEAEEGEALEAYRDFEPRGRKPKPRR